MSARQLQKCLFIAEIPLCTVIDPSGLPGRGDHFTIVNDLSDAPRDCRGQQAQVNVKISARADNGSRIFVCEPFADGADASARLAGGTVGACFLSFVDTQPRVE